MRTTLLGSAAAIAIAASSAIAFAQAGRSSSEEQSPDRGRAPTAQNPGASGTAQQNAPSSGSTQMNNRNSAQGSSPDQGSRPSTAQERTQPNTRENAQTNSGPNRTGQSGGPATGQTTGAPSGAAGREAAVNVTEENRTKLRSQITHVSVREASDVKLSLNVGVVAPTTIERYWAPVPQEIVEIMPAWRAYRIVKIEGRFVIIEPATRKIVYIIDA